MSLKTRKFGSWCEGRNEGGGWGDDVVLTPAPCLSTQVATGEISAKTGRGCLIGGERRRKSPSGALRHSAQFSHLIGTLLCGTGYCAVETANSITVGKPRGRVVGI